MRHFLYLCFISVSLLTFSLAGCAVETLTEEPNSANAFTVYPPFAENKRFMISQSFNSIKSHTGELNAYAVDFIMPAGEPVCAAIAGVVESYNDTDRPMAEDKNFREDNFVRILHSDRTRGIYAHLLPGSITVRPGHKVQKGECFARVGSTGYSNGPHLHFALLKLLPDRFISVPFRFVQPDGQVLEPKFLRWIANY